MSPNYRRVQLPQRLPASTFDHLQHWADGQISLQQLARHLNRPVTVARAIYPLIQKGWVQNVWSYRLLGCPS